MIRPCRPARRRSWRPLILVSLFATACGDEASVAIGSTDLQVDRQTIDFGRVFVGQEPVETFTVRNVGDVALSYTIISTGDGAFFFTPTVGTLPPNGQAQVQVLFQPQEAAERSTVLRITSDATQTATASVDVRGVALDPPDCEDGNGCTRDRFDLVAERCVHEAVAVPCNDFNACTTQDTCVDGMCRGVSVLCNDGDRCTDDVCDPQAGCVFLPSGVCNDGNLCTIDICLPNGCRYEDVADGTPCDDFEQCTIADICLSGRCRGVDIPEGSDCDDGDPCSLNELCIRGECIDPTYTPPAFGEIAYTATVGALAPRASENLLVDRNNTTFVGTEEGVVAVDECGLTIWVNDMVGVPSFEAAVSVPGLLTIPSGHTIFDVETETGAPVGALDLLPPVQTASTATTTVTGRITDIAVRTSGALVAGVTRTITTTTATVTEGFLVEVNPRHTIATVFRELNDRFAARLAIDADESVVAILRGLPTSTSAGDVARVVRFGIDGVDGGSWTTEGIEAEKTDIALGPEGEVLWAAGLTRIDRQGNAAVLIEPAPDPAARRAGSPITDGPTVYVLQTRPGEGGDPQSHHLVALTTTTGVTRFEVELPGPAIQHSPVVDAGGRIYLVTSDGVLMIVDREGEILVQEPLPLTSTPLQGVAMTLNRRGTLLLGVGDQLIGIQGANGLGNSSWPRHRRDNLASGHR